MHLHMQTKTKEASCFSPQCLVPTGEILSDVSCLVTAHLSLHSCTQGDQVPFISSPDDRLACRAYSNLSQGPPNNTSNNFLGKPKAYLTLPIGETYRLGPFW